MSLLLLLRQFEEGPERSADFSASSSVTAAGAAVRSRTAALSATGAVTVSGARVRSAAVALAASTSVTGSALTAEEIQLDADTSYCWFNDPHFISQTYGGQHWTHLGGVAKNGDAIVTTLNIDTGVRYRTVLHAALNVDDHAAPGLCVMSDGTLFATYSQHTGSGIWWRRTTNPADPTSWGTETYLTPGALGVTHVTYPKPIQFASGRLMVIARIDVGNQQIMWSDNGGSTWSALYELIENGSARPYTTLAYDNVGDQVDISYTDGHPRDVANSQWHVTLDEDGNVYESDGTLIKNVVSSGTAMAASAGTQIFAYSASTGRTWGWNVCRDPNVASRIHVVFARYENDSPYDHRYCYGRWDGGGWVVEQDVLAATAGWSIFGDAGFHSSYGAGEEFHYSGGLQLDKSDPSDIVVSRLTARGYVGEVISDVPTTVWKLDETSGTTAVDVKNLASHDGSYVGSPTLGVAGALGAGTGVQVAAASTQDITLPNPAVQTNCTIEFWFKWTAGAAVLRDNTSTGTSWLAFDNSGTFGVRIGEATTRNTSLATTAVRDGNWHHFVLTKTGAAADVYVDNVNVLSVASGISASAAAMPWHFGRNGSANSWSDAVYDTIAIYPAAITPTRVGVHFNARNTVDNWKIERWAPAPGGYQFLSVLLAPTAYYRLGDQGGTTASDSGGSGHHGTYVNSPTLRAPGSLAREGDSAITLNASSSQRVDTTTLGTLGSNLLTMTAHARVKVTSNAATGTIFGTVNDSSTTIVALHTNCIFATNETYTPGGTLFMLRSTGGVVLGAHVTPANATVDIYDGAWHSVAVRVDSSTTASIFFDGVQQTVTYGIQQAQTGANFQYPMSLGARNVRSTTWDRYLTGSLDEVAFYPTRLSNNTIARLHLGAVRGVQAGFQVETGTGVKRMRPITPERPSLLGTGVVPLAWLEGTYNTYSSFDTAARAIVPRVAGITAATGLSATGAILASGQRTLQRAASLSATSAVTVSGARVVARSATLSATGAVVAFPQRTALRLSGISATGAVTVSGQRTLQRSASFAATGTVNASAVRVHVRATSLSAASSITTAPQRARLRAAALAASGDVTASGLRVHVRSATLAATGAVVASGQIVGGQVTWTRSFALSASSAVVASGLRVHPRSATLAATGTVVVAGQRSLLRTAALSASGAVTVSALRVHLRSATLSATGAVVVSGLRVRLRSASLAATGAVTVAPQRTLQRSVGLAAGSSISATPDGTQVLQRSATLAATGALAAGGLRVRLRAATLAATGTVTVTGQRALRRSATLSATTALFTGGSPVTVGFRLDVSKLDIGQLGAASTLSVYERRIGVHAFGAVSVAATREQEGAAELAATSGMASAGAVVPGVGVRGIVTWLAFEAPASTAAPSVAERSVSFDAAAQVTVRGIRIKSRSAAFQATTAITSRGERSFSVELAAHAAVTVGSYRELVRRSTFAATGTVTTGTTRRTVVRSASLTAQSGISAQRAIQRTARLAAQSGISTTAVLVQAVGVRGVVTWLAFDTPPPKGLPSVASRDASFSAQAAVSVAAEPPYVPGGAGLTHPPLNGVFDETSSGGRVAEHPRGGVPHVHTTGGRVKGSVRIGLVVTLPRGGLHDESVSGGLLLNTTRGGEIVRSLGGIFDTSATGGIITVHVRGGRYKTGVRGGRVRGGVIKVHSRGGRVVENQRGGRVREPSKGGIYELVGTGGDVL